MLRRTLPVLLFCMLGTALHAQWQSAILTQHPISCIGFLGTDLYAGDLNGSGVFRSSDLGTTWTPMGAGLPHVEMWSFGTNGTTLFVGTAFGPYRWSAGDTTWTASAADMLDRPVKCFAISGSYLVAGTYGNGVIRSNDNGEHWTKAEAGLTEGSIAAVAVTGKYLFAGSANNGSVFRSEDDGATWTRMDAGLPGVNIYAFAMIGTDLFAGTYGHGVYRSSNNGATWMSANTGLANVVVYALATDGSTMLAGTDHGLFISNNNGATWNENDSGFANTHVVALAINGPNVFAASVEKNIWRRPLSELRGTEGVNDVGTAATAMLSAYPNPAAGLATVRYTLPETATVQLSLFDALGHLVLAQPEVREEAGVHSATMDASTLRDGIYLVRLRAGTRSSCARMVVMH